MGFSRGGRGFGGGGGGRGRGFGNRGGGRGGGRGGYGQSNEPPESVVEFGTFTHECENQLVVKAGIEQVPFFNAPMYLENKEQVGKVDEIFGSIRDYSVSVVLRENFKASSFKPDQKLYIDPNKLLPLERFLPKPPGEKKRGGGGRGRGGRGGRGGSDRGRGGGGFRGGRGGNFGNRDSGGRGGFGGRDSGGRGGGGFNNRDGGGRGGRDSGDGFGGRGRGGSGGFRGGGNRGFNRS